MAERKNFIIFPHVIPGATLGGKVHDKNSINAGVKKLGDFGIERSSFYGGRVAVLGLIAEYGFYGCIDYADNALIGFYVHDPKMVTELGRKVLKDRFPNNELVFDDVPEENAGMTVADLAEMRELKAKIEKSGYSPAKLTHVNAEELKGLWAALQSGTAETKMFEEPVEKLTVLSTEDTKVTFTGNPIPADVVKKVASSRKKAQGQSFSM